MWRMSLGGQEDGDRHAFAAEAKREVRTGSASEEEWSLGLKLEAKSELRTFNSLLLCDSHYTGQSKKVFERQQHSVSLGLKDILLDHRGNTPVLSNTTNAMCRRAFFNLL